MTELNLTTGDVAADTASTVPAALTNDKRLSELTKQVTKLGEEASLGKDSLPKLAHAVVRAAADGIIDLETKTKDKAGKDQDAATVIYAAYASGESKKAIHEHSDGGKKANVSKLRQLIAMGAMTTVDAVMVMQEAFNARENMSREDGVKVKSAYPFYVDVAREQLKSDKPLSMDELEAIVKKPAPEPKELETELKAILKRLEDLTSGEGKAKLKDQSDLTIAAFEAIKERVDQFATMRAHIAIREQAAKLGLKLA